MKLDDLEKMVERIEPGLYVTNYGQRVNRSRHEYVDIPRGADLATAERLVKAFVRG